MLSRRLIVSLTLLVGAGACPPFARAQDLSRAVPIDVVANDYAFTPLPARIAAGPTMFTFANQGKVNHEMSIGRLKPGATIDDLLRVSKEGGRLRDIITRSVGILVAGPGKSPDGRLLVDLLSGETYVLLCNFKDTPDAPTHMTLGMYATFRPR
jgi:plastocyanin